MSIIISNNLGELPYPDYKYITKTEDALKCLEFIEKHSIIEVDTETTGLDPFVDKVVLLQLGVEGQPFIFDVRKGNVDISIFKNLLESENHLKLLQNALFDIKMLKTNFGITVKRIYDTMLAEQLLFLGLKPEANLQHLVAKYLRLHMPKEIARSFKNYYQEYSKRQLIYAANDVVILKDIYNLQLKQLKEKNLIRVTKLEFDFVRALSEMELNGMLLDVNKWREILKDIEIERNKLGIQLQNILGETSNQNTLFGVSLINLDSPIQLVKALNKLGIDVESTDVKTLNKYKNHPVIQLLLEYRKHEKFLTTYGEALIERIHPKTGRLHSDFKQMVDTGRLSSSNPNLQNIPAEKNYRSCFIAREGYKLIDSDMSQAELRILAAYSKDPVFLEAFEKGLDLHARTAADLFGVSYEEVLRDKELPDDDPNKKHYRSHVKALNFGLCINEDSKILTPGGFKYISDIKINDKIINQFGVHEVIDVAYKGYKEVVHIELENGFYLDATENHIIPVINDEGLYLEKPVFEITLLDRLICINNGKIFSSGIKNMYVSNQCDVYDLSIDKYPYFIANNILVHNCYGLTMVGLARRLGISEEKAQKLIDQYFSKYKNVARWLDNAGKFALTHGYSVSRSGRRRHYRIPEPSDPEYNRLKGHIERQGKNMPIQGCLKGDTLIFDKWRIDELVNKKIRLPNGNIARGVYNGRKEVYKLSFTNGLYIFITLNHYLPVYINGKIVDKPVSKLKLNLDKVLIPSNNADYFTKPDFTTVSNLEFVGIQDVYDLICEREPHYYIANDILVHNSNADTIKQAMVYIVDRIDKGKLLSTVHDEVIVEAKAEDAEEVAYEVSKALCDGFAEFVPEVKMKADAVVEDYWSKG